MVKSKTSIFALGVIFVFWTSIQVASSPSEVVAFNQRISEISKSIDSKTNIVSFLSVEMYDDDQLFGQCFVFGQLFGDNDANEGLIFDELSIHQKITHVYSKIALDATIMVSQLKSISSDMEQHIYNCTGETSCHVDCQKTLIPLLNELLEE